KRKSPKKSVSNSQPCPPPSPCHCVGRAAQFNGPPSATASAEGFRAACSASARHQFNGASSLPLREQRGSAASSGLFRFRPTPSLTHPLPCAHTVAPKGPRLLLPHPAH